MALNEKPGTSAIWLGPDDADPKVLATMAASMGVETDETEGWVAYPMPDQVSLHTRMHLNRKQVASLIEHLTAWLEHYSFKL